ncbi:MAG: cytochrome c oxidase assembly protein [Geminicoccaceae bacterium]|nr:cytochrome c oxidase assembly protein [Geminicoccaceae bacterium]MCS7266538.1 cytochrome c oxidase assembly protein [Geminicoccaceae bacterium]MCX7628965.1 cytochrome c oxidase assembly protein [Geminicoccaceae bacterium]MDW8125639.1 cytochrome c oxidase assembly protein [Geminicoccaceae bacterium]MDW8340071.1 cytochrome c oxidase assembly protein [Geminicoccaceae bacterium]
MNREARIRSTALAAVAVIAAMIGLTAAAVPLYDLFCRVTGYGGTTQRAEAPPTRTAETTVTVFFNADVARDLPWRFQPLQRRLEVRPGEQHLAFYAAENRGSEPVVGTATFNVTPHKVGIYFHKLACFCFEQQRLDPGQTIEMPVSFYVDPAMLEDPATREVRQITLSYTFFVDREATEALRARRGAASSS